MRPWPPSWPRHSSRWRNGPPCTGLTTNCSPKSRGARADSPCRPRVPGRLGARALRSPLGRNPPCSQGGRPGPIPPKRRGLTPFRDPAEAARLTLPGCGSRRTRAGARSDNFPRRPNRPASNPTLSRTRRRRWSNRPSQPVTGWPPPPSQYPSCSEARCSQAVSPPTSRRRSAPRPSRIGEARPAGPRRCIARRPTAPRRC